MVKDFYDCSSIPTKVVGASLLNTKVLELFNKAEITFTLTTMKMGRLEVLKS